MWEIIWICLSGGNQKRENTFLIEAHKILWLLVHFIYKDATQLIG